MIVDVLNTNEKTQILGDELNTTKVCSKMVLKNFIRDQKDNRKNIALTSSNCLRKKFPCSQMSSHKVKHEFSTMTQKCKCQSMH